MNRFSDPMRLSVLVALLLVLAAPPASAAPKGDTVSGTGRVAPYGTAMSGGQGTHKVEFSVNARSEADGSNPSGTIRYRIAGWAEATADVTCLWTNGDRAVAGGVIRAGYTQPGYGILLLALEDNGPPGTASDMATPFISPSSEDPYTICADRAATGEAFIARQVVTSGNISVRDA
jgi:hypothetical protein